MSKRKQYNTKMGEVFFSKFYGKMRFPIFPTLRIYSDYWMGEVLSYRRIMKGRYTDPMRAKVFGKAILLSVIPVKYGALPKEFVEYDTDLCYMDAEDLFSQMHKTKWDGKNTNLAMLILQWTDRSKTFYDDLNKWKKTSKEKKKNYQEVLKSAHALSSKPRRRSK